MYFSTVFRLSPPTQTELLLTIPTVFLDFFIDSYTTVAPTHPYIKVSIDKYGCSGSSTYGTVQEDVNKEEHKSWLKLGELRDRFFTYMIKLTKGQPDIHVIIVILPMHRWVQKDTTFIKEMLSNYRALIDIDILFLPFKKNHSLLMVV